MAEVLLHVKVVPGASRNRVAGRYGDGIKVQVAAAPERGRANDAVVELLSEWLGVRPQQLRISAGLTQPRKTVAITGKSMEQINERLEQMQ